MLTIIQDPDITITATILNESGVQQGEDVTLSESPRGFYSGTVDLTGFPDGAYCVIFNSEDLAVGFGRLYVRDELEVSQDQFELKAEADARQTVLTTTLATQETKAEADARQTVLTTTLATQETKAEADARQSALIVEHEATQNTLATQETKAQADARQSALIAEHNTTQGTLATQETKAQADARQTVLTTTLATQETKAQADARQSTLIAEHDATQATLATQETKAEANTRQSALIAEHEATQQAIDDLTPVDVSVLNSVNDTSATVTSFITNLTENTDGHFNNAVMIFTSGVLHSQGRIISSYGGANKSVTFEKPWTDAPSDGDEFRIYPAQVHTLNDIATMPIPGS